MPRKTDAKGARPPAPRKSKPQRRIDDSIRDQFESYATEDEKLLQALPHPDDFTRSDTWRVLRIQGEFIEGFDKLASVGEAVTVFGSARTGPDDPQDVAAVARARRAEHLRRRSRPDVGHRRSEGSREDRGEGVPSTDETGRGAHQGMSKKKAVTAGARERGGVKASRHGSKETAQRANAAGPKGAQKKAAEEREAAGKKNVSAEASRFLRGKKIDPRRIDGTESVVQLIEETFQAYNSGRL